MKQGILAIIGLVLFFLMAAGLFFIGEVAIQSFARLDASLRVSIISAFALIIVAIITYLTNKSMQIKQLTDQSVRADKVELYKEVYAFYLRVLGKDEIVKNPTAEEIQQFFVDKTPRFLAFASNEVVAKFGHLRVTPVDPNDKTYASLFQLEDLMFAIRRDMGHGRRKNKKGDILRLFVNDIDDFLQPSKK